MRVPLAVSGIVVSLLLALAVSGDNAPSCWGPANSNSWKNRGRSRRSSTRTVRIVLTRPNAALQLQKGEPVLAWIRGKYDGGAIPVRFFLAPYRVISDTYGVFYDPDAGYMRGYEAPNVDDRGRGDSALSRYAINRYAGSVPVALAKVMKIQGNMGIPRNECAKTHGNPQNLRLRTIPQARYLHKSLIHNAQRRVVWLIRHRRWVASLDFRFHGWRNGILVMRHKDGTLYSALSGKAFDGPRKGRRAEALSITHIYIVHSSARMISRVEKQGITVVSRIGTVLAL